MATSGKDSLPKVLGWALPLQIIWAVLASIWNIAGVILVSQGQQPLGPTATLTGAAVLAVAAVVLYWSVGKAPYVYVLLSALAGIMAALTVYGAITGEPSQWPAPFWRIAGAVLNVAGVIGAAAGIIGFFKWRGRGSS